MMKEIYLIRHGRTDYNRLGIWQGSGVDAPLDELGREQARHFFNNYGHVDFDLIIHSGLKRSKETVDTFIGKGIDSIESTLINEISWGVFEGKPHTEESLNHYKNVVEEWGKGNYDSRLPGGESAQELGERLSQFSSHLKKMDYKKILICSHGRAMRGLLCVMQNEPLSGMEKYIHANTGLFKATLLKDKFNFSTFNNIDHLNK